MSFQSTNGNQSIVMIPTSDDQIDVEPTSSAELKSEPIQSPTKNIPLKKENENEMEIESLDESTKVVETLKSDDTTVKLAQKLNCRDANYTNVRKKPLVKRNWKIAHNRMILNHNKDKNGFRRTCQKNIKIQYKRLASLIPKKSSMEKQKNIEGNKQQSEQILPELCSPSDNCISSKETYIDKPESPKHTKIAHPDVIMKFCGLCDDTFFHEDELKNHISTIHGQSSTIIKQENNLQQLNILNDMENNAEISCESISKNTPIINPLTNETNSKINIGIKMEKIPTETLEFIENATIESTENFPYAVKVEIAERENDIFSYTALEEKKECIKSNDSFEKVNEMAVVKCEWTSPKPNDSNEIIQDSVSMNNESNMENCLISSMEEFQDIEELETSCEVDNTEKVGNIDELVKNKDSVGNEYKTELICDMSNGSMIESIKSIDNEQNGVLSSPNLIPITSSDTNILSSFINSSSSSSIYRTYLSKVHTQVLKKSPKKFNNIKRDEENFCIMCREIFSLIEQKSGKTNSNAESTFKCPLCSRQFVSRLLLEKHVAYHHLHCECTKIVKSPTSTVALDASTVPEIYECVLCSSVFDNYNGLNHHILSLHEPMPPFKDRLTIGKPEYLRTVRCSYMESKMSLAKNRNNSVNVLKIKCPNCESEFFTCDDYILHVKELHSEMTAIENNSWSSLEKSQIFENSTSHISMNELNIDNSNKIFNDLGVTKTSNELRKTCKRCNKEFETIRELSEHFYFSHDDTLESQAIIAEATITDKRSHDWRCLHCSQRFKLLQSYIRHRYFVHNDESMVHVCENCSKILTSITMVNVHVCLNVPSWICKPCNQSFQNGVELHLHNSDKHMETPGPHICSICDKRFLTMSMLRRHEDLKNCYPHVRPPEKLNTMESPFKRRRTKKSTIVTKKQKLSSEKKSLRKEYTPQIQDLPSYMRVLQENDVLIQDADDDNSLQNKNHNSSSMSPKSSQSEEIYQCSMCKLYFLSRAGLKIHLSRAHTSAVEICQLCYKMFVTGNLVRHITDNHIKHDNNNEAHYKAMRVKQHNTFQIEEHDIERDTEELITTIGPTQLLGLCEYQRFTEQSDDNDRYCPDCPLTFDSSEKYRRHYIQTHDKLCALCNIEFETGQEAARHKTRIHGSMACYIWFAHKLIAAISDTKTFSEMAEKIIIGTIPIEENFKITTERNHREAIYDNEVEMGEVEGIYGTNEKLDNESYDNRWERNNLDENKFNEEESCVLENINYCENEINVADNDDAAAATASTITTTTTTTVSSSTVDCIHEYEDDDDDLDEYKFYIVVTEDDLEKYKDNITELARQIYSTCNIFSINQIERMLEPYAE